MKKKETFTLSRSFGLKRRFRPYKVLFLGAAGYKNAFIYPPAFFSSRSCKPNHRAARARKFVLNSRRRLDCLSRNFYDRGFRKIRHYRIVLVEIS